MNRDRQRGKYNRKSKRVILVSYEGNNKTERYYFDSFKGIDKNYTIKTVPGNETDPVSLVKQTINKVKELRLDLSKDDKAYCIFDTDIDLKKNVQIRKAIELGKLNNICIITSSPCIEFWFLIHYEYTTKYLTNNDAIKRLKEYCSDYSKNCNMYSILYSKLNTAIENAKKLEKFHLSNNISIQTVEANPHTDVYLIVEELSK